MVLLLPVSLLSWRSFFFFFFFFGLRSGFIC